MADEAKAPTPPAPTGVPVINPAGKLVRIAEADLPDATSAEGGYVVASPQQIAEREQDKGTFTRLREKGVSAPVALGLSAVAPGAEYGAWREGGIEGFTGGMGQAAVASTLGQMRPEWGTGYKADNVQKKTAYPGVYEGGVVVGNISRDAALMSVGMSPGLAVEEAVGARLGGLASKGFLGRAAASGIRNAAGAGVESAGYGMVKELSEEMLGDHELNVGKILMAGPEEGLMGAVFGGGIGVGGSLVASGGKAVARKAAGVALDAGKAANTLFKRAIAEESATGAASPFVDAYAKAAAMASGGDEAVIRKLLTDKRARHIAAFEAPAIRDQASRDVRKNLNVMMKSTDQITDEARGALKRSYVEGAVARGNEAAVGEHTWNTIKSLDGEITSMIADPDKFGSKGPLKSMKKFLELKQEEVLAAVKAGDVASQFIAIDEIKRGLGRYTKASQSIGHGQGDALKFMQNREFGDKMRGLYEGTRVNLENVGVWGRAAEDQAAINAAWSKQIDSQRQFSKLTTEGPRDPANPWRTLKEIDPEKADAYVKGLMNPSKDLIHQGVKNYVDASQDLANTIRRAYDLPADKLAHVDLVGKSAAEFKASIAKSEEAITHANHLDELKRAEGGGNGLPGLALSAALGPLGAAGALAHDVVSRPGHTIQRLAAAEKALARVVNLESIQRAIKQADEHITLAAKGLTGSPTKSLASKTGDATLVRRYAEAVKHVAKVKSDPDGVMRVLMDSPLPHAPNTSAAISLTIARSLAYLSSKVPPDLNQPTLGMPERQPRASMPEMVKFLATYEAVKNPRRVFDNLAAGVVKPEEVYALRDMNPKLYAELQARTLEQIAERQAGSKPLSERERMRLGIVLGIESDPALNPKVLNSLQLSLRSQDQPKDDAAKVANGPSRPINIKPQSSGIDGIEVR